MLPKQIKEGLNHLPDLRGDVADVKAFHGGVPLGDQLIIGDSERPQRLTQQMALWLAQQLPVLRQMLQQHSGNTCNDCLFQSLELLKKKRGNI